MGKGPTLADGLAHDCVTARCYGPDGMRWPVQPVHLKWQDVQRTERGKYLTDNFDRKDVKYVCGLGLSEQDWQNLHVIAAEGTTKSFGLIMRRLAAREAKAILKRKADEAKAARASN